MKCLLLAAGRGTRISRCLNDRPKCTVGIGDTSLIRYTVDLLKKYGVSDISLSVGYKKEDIQQELQGENCKFYYNPFFDVTNSVASAWFAKEVYGGEYHEPVLIMNADVYLEESLLKEILDSAKKPFPEDALPVRLYMDSSRIKEADYRFAVRDGMLEKYGKELTDEETSGEYIGVALLSGAFLPRFAEKIDEMIDNQKHSVWWENAIYAFAEEERVPVSDVRGKFWAEVDYIEDYMRILDHCSRQQEKVV